MQWCKAVKAKLQKSLTRSLFYRLNDAAHLLSGILSCRWYKNIRWHSVQVLLRVSLLKVINMTNLVSLTEGSWRRDGYKFNKLIFVGLLMSKTLVEYNPLVI